MIEVDLGDDRVHLTDGIAEDPPLTVHLVILDGGQGEVPEVGLRSEDVPEGEPGHHLALLLFMMLQ